MRKLTAQKARAGKRQRTSKAGAPPRAASPVVCVAPPGPAPSRQRQSAPAHFFYFTHSAKFIRFELWSYS